MLRQPGPGGCLAVAAPESRSPETPSSIGGALRKPWGRRAVWGGVAACLGAAACGPASGPPPASPGGTGAPGGGAAAAAANAPATDSLAPLPQKVLLNYSTRGNGQAGMWLVHEGGFLRE